MSADIAETPIAVGDWCTWFHVPRGGWGRLWPVDAHVKELRGEKAKIEVTLRHGERTERWVKASNLRRWEQQPAAPPSPASGDNEQT